MYNSKPNFYLNLIFIKNNIIALYKKMEINSNLVAILF